MRSEADTTAERPDIGAAELCLRLLSHKKCRDALAAFAGRNLTLEVQLQLLGATVAQPQVQGWHQIGHPHESVCLQMAAALEALSGSLTEPDPAVTAQSSTETATSSWPCSWRHLLGIATIGSPLDVEYGLIVRALGPTECSHRLRQFAWRLRSAVLVG